MGNALTEKRVNCRRCGYRFPIQVQPAKDWRVGAQCPSCEGWSCFTLGDTCDPARLDPLELDKAAQRLGEQLWQPINEHRDHPAVAWMDRVGNGVFADDRSAPCWPVPWCVYRFTRRAEAAYIWQEKGSWFVRGWYSLRDCHKPPEAAEVFSFEAALNRLVE
jgi:hypothetical protein